MRNIWEGGDEGEGQIKYLKKNLKHGLKKGFAKNCLKKYYEDRFIQLHFIKNDIHTNKKYMAKNFILYKTHAKFMTHITDNKCISLCLVKLPTGEEKLVAVLKQLKIHESDGRSNSVTYQCTNISITRNEKNPTYFGQTYYNIQVTNFNQISIVSDNIQKYIVGLPYRNKYCFIASDWTDMDYEYTSGLFMFHLPNIS